MLKIYAYNKLMSKIEWSPGVLLHWFSGEMLMDLSRFSTSTHGRPSGTESLKYVKQVML